jgi:DNA adenine methylase
MLQVDCSTNKGGPPLIKWPGGKRALVPKLLSHAPRKFGTYYEPFFGGGALFFALSPRKAVLGDLNQELINCYRCIQNQPSQLIALLKRKKNSEVDYYRVRSMRPRTDLGRAARLLFLTRLSFNGIHRVNLRGEFNVPYGYKTWLDTVDATQLLATAEALKRSEVRCGDFIKTTKDARAGDFIFFDPPYTVAHANNGFLKYNENIFSWADQVRLLEYAKLLAKRGCRILISNADHDSIVDLYGGIERHIVERHSVIAASSQHRRKISESLFVLNGE